MKKSVAEIQYHRAKKFDMSFGVIFYIATALGVWRQIGEIYDKQFMS